MALARPWREHQQHPRRAAGGPHGMALTGLEHHQGALRACHLGACRGNGYLARHHLDGRPLVDAVLAQLVAVAEVDDDGPALGR